MKGRERFLKIVFFLLMIVPANWSAAYGATLNVREGSLNPDEYTAISEAITEASGGDTIMVAAGTYPENLVISKPIKIICEGDPTAVTDPTLYLCTINGQDKGSVVTFTSGAIEGTLLSGFIITGGKDDNGGGILCERGATPTISYCSITGNTATNYGGGISSRDSSSPIITNCHIEGNSAEIGGGGLHCYNSSPIITACAITKNMAWYFGAGAYLEEDSSPAISNCMITGNSTTWGGGGIACSIASSPIITNSTVAGNLVTDKSDESSYGGGIYLYGGCMPTITNSVFWNNDAQHGSEIYMMDDCTLKISYSNIKGGLEGVSGDMTTSTAMSTASTTNSILDWSDTNKNSDPRFVNETAGDYHLASDSPCIDAGTNVVVNSGSTDFEGNPRILGLNVDIGADEAQSESVDETEVEIVVRPGSRHNKIDLSAWGFLPVAVLSTADFNATSIDPETVEFAGAKPMHSIRTHVNRDRRADMLFFFWIRHLDFDLDENGTKAPVTTEAILTGETNKGESIIGTDTVTVINPKHKRHWWSRFEQMSQKKVQCNSK
jgi:parallel beta-helix repeat protein